MSGSATSTTTTPAVPPPIPPVVSDQSAIFFPGPKDVAGLDLGQVDRDQLSELYALRQIDLCGFVDRQTLASDGRENFSYNYAARHMIAYGAVSPVRPIGGEGCTVAFPGGEIGLAIELWPGEPRWNDRDFRPDPTHPGVEKLGSHCQFRVHLPLSGLPGAPAAMRDPAVAVTPVELTKDRWSIDDASLCRLAETVAGQAADSIVSSSDGSVQPSEHDGMTLLDCRAHQDGRLCQFRRPEDRCQRRTDKIGPDAPPLAAVTPIVTVELNTPNDTSCTVIAEQTALDTARQALGN